jgi:hypothetical protein
VLVTLWPCHLQEKKKSILKAKEEEKLWKLKYFTMQKHINLQKKYKSSKKKKPKILRNILKL